MLPSYTSLISQSAGTPSKWRRKRAKWASTLSKAFARLEFTSTALHTGPEGGLSSLHSC